MTPRRRERTVRVAAALTGLALFLPATMAAAAGASPAGAPGTTAPAGAPSGGDARDATGQEYSGYLFAYFAGEGYADGEQIYLGLSEGDDPLHYQDLNDNQPVLTSDVGERGVRDPFIIRSPEDDRFYMIATDLKIHGGGDWDDAQRHGSRSIVVWESTDLINWSDERLVEVSPPEAGNTWAPEAYWDEDLGEFVVFWASKLYAEDDPDHTGDSYNRMMYATTTDFTTFSEPETWVDPGYSVIDSTVARDDDGTYYRFTKDERNNTSSTPCSKFILAERSTELRSTDWDFVTECIGKANSLGPGIDRGEGPTIFKSNSTDEWYLFVDEFGGRGYVPFVADSLDAPEWRMADDYKMPTRPRHGTVLPVTAEEYDRILRHYQPDAYVESVEPVEVTVQARHEPVLPGRVAVTYADGSTGTEKVTWDDVDPSAYARPGTAFEVPGTLRAGVTARAAALVTVQARRIPVTSLTVAPGAVQLWRGTEHALEATVEPANASDRRLRWYSADDDVATVSDDGVVRAVAPGTTTVTARARGSLRASTEVTVTADPPGLVAHYPLDATSGTEATNAAPGSAFGPATLRGGAEPTADGVVLDGVDDHVDLPDHLLADLTDVSVTLDVLVDPSQRTPYFIYGMGNSSGNAGDGYLFTTGDSYRSSITLGNWSGEQTVSKGSGLDRGVWKNIAYTLQGTTAVLYEDGVEVARQEGVTIDPRDIGDGETVANYIGRSLYSGDRYLHGSVRDFRLYDRALSADEVAYLGTDHTAVRGAELDELRTGAVVHGASSTVTLPVEPGTDVAALAPVLDVSGQATVEPANGAVRDFSSPVTYTVTGPDGESREWTVRAVEMRSPVLPGLWADPNIAQFGDTFYLYATTDGFPGWGGKEFYVWTSSDLVNWEKSAEPILTLDGADGDVPWATGNAWAPTIAERDGKYYFYFSGHHPELNRKTIGVAVADSPTGRFTAEPEAMITNEEPVTTGQAIDPAWFRDPQTGTHYLFWGNGGPLYAELGDDMVSVDEGTIARIEGLPDFREGLFVNYRDGMYHLTYSIDDTGSENYRVGYATATSVHGPWSYQGLLLEKDLSLGVAGTGHSSILNVSGTDDWYIAYHRHAIPDGDGTHRETTIDAIEVGDDGLFRPVTPTLGGVEPR
ncbi:family 43 glycosylhydrolase [Myceligenerans salitolerans]|uniref:Family 43 glycosylhydrolase n=1 Tax=Myceligenerans salitolerans TaxID=1230528 RepID=A0ABS3ICK9_9MICO|nr:family 43 glycosylhydrolase [Myceligenerans salitolerans]MBO0610751.1 family 43 glycosylhydrolase [Myceligenerans salitolerans]